ncbi:response regulator [Dactylosporangium sp. NPDC005555]|uniref:response regulator n=1 Tax=Dactylosporangium sp. NPDC005555 TaxID=3154889 RepID=UPI0033BBE2E8
MATVVVADDDADITDVVAMVLRRAGHSVVTCADGEELLAAVRAHRPDVIVTDHQMPALTGLEARGRLLRDPATAGIPVIVASGSVSGAEAAAVLVPGDRLLGKPYSGAQLRDAVAEAALHHPAG